MKININLFKSKLKCSFLLLNRYFFNAHNRLVYGIRFLGKEIYIDPTCKISRKSVIRVFPKGRGYIKIGKNSSVHDYAYIETYGGKIEIGDNSSINHFTIMRGGGGPGIRIGSGVRISPHCSFFAYNHKFSDKNEEIYLQGYTMEGIVIEDDVWIGSGVNILDGVVVSKGSIIGAGSVVTKSIPEYSIAVGSPARVIKKRGDDSLLINK